MLWLWGRSAATALIRPLAWEPPCAAGVALKKTKKKKKCPQALAASLGTRQSPVPLTRLLSPMSLGLLCEALAAPQEVVGGTQGSPALQNPCSYCQEATQFLLPE